MPSTKTVHNVIYRTVNPTLKGFLTEIGLRSWRMSVNTGYLSELQLYFKKYNTLGAHETK